MTIETNPKLEEINAITAEKAKGELTMCCGSTQWVEKMLALRPYRCAEDLYSAADDIWYKLSPADWLEAFSHHPRIGDVETLRAKFASTASWCENEQKGVSQATDETLHELAALNDDYFEKFGYIFIVCATGKSADEMLEILKSRLPNDRADELTIAAGEQAKITKIRLDKLLS